MNLPGAPPACVHWDPCGWPSQVLGLGLFSLRLLPVITAWAQSSFEAPHMGVLPYTFKPLMNHHHPRTECTTFGRVFPIMTR